MLKRMLIMLAALLAFVGLIGFVKFRQINAAIAAGKSFQAPPEAVTTAVARAENWDTIVQAVGSAEAIQGVTLSADQPGTVAEILFQSGSEVAAGQTLVRLDTRQERAQLASAEAQRDLAKLGFDRSTKLLQVQAISQADYDQASAQYQQADANVNAITATIDRKTIRAPFAGLAGIRQVALGQYLRSGDPVVPLQSTEPVYVNFSVPQDQVAALHVGDAVQATDGNHAAYQGKISAINSVVDSDTRNIQVQATFHGTHGRLRTGAYVDVTVAVGNRRPVVVLPASAINYAPYGNSVFIVGNLPGPQGGTYKGVRQQFVKLDGSRGDQVAIIDGVKAGEEVVSSGVFKLRNGEAVTVNNKVQPSDSATPHPQDS